MSKFASPLFGTLMGEYVVHFIIHHERHFSSLPGLKQDRVWGKEKLSNHRAMQDLTVGVMGLGSVAKCSKSSHATVGSIILQFFFF